MSMDDDQISQSEILNPPFSEPSVEIYRDNNYVRTTHGLTSYQLFEPQIYTDEQGIQKLRPRLIKSLNDRKYPKQPKIILGFHGLVIWSVTFHPLIQSLINEEFTVLVFDFYGRGKSEAPNVQYTLDLYLSQGIDLLDYLNIEKVYLIGYSMGGAVASHFASNHPQRLIKLLLMGPALPPVATPFMAKLVVMPYIGKFIFSLFGTKTLLSRLENDRLSNDFYAESLENFDIRIIDDLIEKIKWQILEKPNYLNAFHSTLCNIPFQNGFAHLFQNIPKSLPIYVILGTKDQTILYENSINFFKSYSPHAIIQSLPCGHSFTIEQPKEVSKFIISSLKE